MQAARPSTCAAQALKVVAQLPAGVADSVKRYLAEHAPARVVLAGDGWPTDMTSATETTSLRGYLRTLSTHRQGTRSPYTGVVAVNLFPHYNAYLVRVLLLSATKQLIIIVADHAGDSLFNAKRDDPLRALIDSAYRVVARERGNATRPGMVLLRPVRPEEADAVGSLLRFLIDHPQARLVNAWREALIAWGTEQGRRLSKNQVRQVIEGQRLGTIHAHSYLSDLSLSDLRALVIAVEQTFAALNRESHEEEPE